MTDQQRNLMSLLELARMDLEAGRPAQGVARAIQNQLNVTRYTDLDDGADDITWRQVRGAGSVERGRPI